MKKIQLMFLLLVALVGTAAMAGTAGDALGLASTWTTIQSWLNDSAFVSIIGLIFFAVGIQRAFMGSVLQFFMMLGMALLVVNADTIMTATMGAIV